jgi:hypothetical protein
MAKKRYTRVEKEVLEILNEVDREPPEPRVRLPRRTPSPPAKPGFLQARGNWLWIGGSIGIALLAIIVRDWSATLATILAILSILIFLSPIVLRFRSGPSAPTTQRWRGRDIELPPPRAGITGEVRYQIWRLRNRR